MEGVSDAKRFPCITILIDGSLRVDVPIALAVDDPETASTLLNELGQDSPMNSRGGHHRRSLAITSMGWSRS